MIEFFILVAILLAVGILWLVVPRGVIVARTPLLPGQHFEFRKTSALPMLSALPATTVRWRGRLFEFVLVTLPSGASRAYIMKTPSYGGYPVTLGATHRLSDSLGRHYVCWEPEPTDPNEMASVIALWIAATCSYRETGVFLNARDARHALRRS